MDDRKVPKLARGCRMGRDRHLLVPEGLLKLSASGARIVELCDGSRTVEGIVATLLAEHLAETAEAREKIRSDVADYLTLLASKKALEWK